MNQDPQTPKKKYNLRERRKKQKKITDHNSDTDSDSDYIPNKSDEEEEEEEFHIREWQRFIGKMFPSKYTTKRNAILDAAEKLSENESKEEYEEEDEEEEEEDAEMYDDDEVDDIFLNNPNMKVNIIFTVGENYEDDLEYIEEGEEEEEEEEEEIKQEFDINDNVEVKLKKFKEWKEGTLVKIKETKNNSYLYRVKVDNIIYARIKPENIRPIKVTMDDNKELLKELRELVQIKKTKGNDALQAKFEKMVSLQEKEITKKQKEEEKKVKISNNRSFKKLLHSRNIMCDLKYFRDLSPSKQKIILDQMTEINKHSQLSKPYCITLLETDIPAQYKVTAFNKINTLTSMDPAMGEYYKIKQWVDTFMRVPFGKYNSLSINLDQGQAKCQTFMENARNQLDTAAYGLNDAKMQIMQMIGQWISNPQSVGTAIAIHGPMGTGKTTLVKEGISKILNRPFAFIALGGATDSSFLEGHSYTYEGSIWGKVVDILIQSKCMNPVIYFDELDKVSETPKGEEIIGILTHLIDSAQNKQFHDKYFSNIDFDLSKALFIFSYNDESKINPILKDRMYTIETKGYTKAEKSTIALKYLIPVIEKNINFDANEIIISDDIIHYIINQFASQEKGVRNLKRCLEIIYTKLNLFRLMKPGSKLFDDKMSSLKVEFPYHVKKDTIDKLIKQKTSDSFSHLYI